MWAEATACDHCVRLLARLPGMKKWGGHVCSPDDGREPRGRVIRFRVMAFDSLGSVDADVAHVKKLQGDAWPTHMDSLCVRVREDSGRLRILLHSSRESELRSIEACQGPHPRNPCAEEEVGGA